VSRSPQTRGQRALFVSTVSPAISGRVLTCVATVSTAESWRMRLYGVDKTPKFLPMPPVAVLHRLGFSPASKFSRVNRLDVSEDGMYFSVGGTSRRAATGQAVGVFPRLSAVLFFGRTRAEEAGGGLWPWWGRPAPGRPPQARRRTKYAGEGSASRPP
jgi:hypothetical protein